MRVVIDPGHGGKDPGAIGPGGKKEKVVVLAVAKKLGKLLQVKHKVLLTRQGDFFVELYHRAILANAFGADLFLSIHCNGASSPSANGFEIWTSRGSTKSDRIATYIARAWSEAFPDVVIRGDWSDGDVDKESNFCVLRRTSMPAVLVELDFITNSKMETLLSNAAYQDLMAVALFRGIEAAFKE
jgi:N-acetylmuramoyl-L-alanine amidase